VPDGYFDEHRAARYDTENAARSTREAVAPAVARLAELARGGSALELGIGTGRIALPLQAHGVHVHGIDMSAAMVARLRAKPGGDTIGVTIGDFATTDVGAAFDLVYLVDNTITNLTTQDAQVQCFASAAAHLTAGGCFVVEVFVPHLRVLPPGQRTRVFRYSPHAVGFDEYTDFVGQVLWSHHYRVDDDGTLDVFAAPFRYVWPSELDLMARLAGLRLRARWADWDRAPFTEDSPFHVSVWERA
jgi:SAM-dependent methyltransferase